MRVEKNIVDVSRLDKVDVEFLVDILLDIIIDKKTVDLDIETQGALLMVLSKCSMPHNEGLIQ